MCDVEAVSFVVSDGRGQGQARPGDTALTRWVSLGLARERGPEVQALADTGNLTMPACLSVAAAAAALPPSAEIPATHTGCRCPAGAPGLAIREAMGGRSAGHGEIAPLLPLSPSLSFLLAGPASGVGSGLACPSPWQLWWRHSPRTTHKRMCLDGLWITVPGKTAGLPHKRGPSPLLPRRAGRWVDGWGR